MGYPQMQNFMGEGMMMDQNQMGMMQQRQNFQLPPEAFAMAPFPPNAMYPPPN